MQTSTTCDVTNQSLKVSYHVLMTSLVLCVCLQGNDVAVAFYKGMGFKLLALEDEMLARSRKRKPRTYLCKSLDR